MSLQMAQFCSILWLSNIALYICTLSSLSIPLLVDQTNLTKLFCLTCGQKARSGGSDVKGQDTREMLVLEHLSSSSTYPPRGIVAPTLRLLLTQPSLQTCWLHIRNSSLIPSGGLLSPPLPNTGSVLPDWSFFIPMTSDSGTQPQLELLQLQA